MVSQISEKSYVQHVIAQFIALHMADPEMATDLFELANFIQDPHRNLDMTQGITAKFSSPWFWRESVKIYVHNRPALVVHHSDLETIFILQQDR